MTDQQSAIAPPPSIDAILTHHERIGRVDFSHRLTPEVPAAVEVESGSPEVEEPTATVEPAPSVQELAGTSAPLQAVPTEDAAPRSEDAAEAEDRHEHEDDDDDESYLDPPLTAADEARLASHPAMREREPSAPHPADESHLPRVEAPEPVAQLLSLVPAEDAGTVAEDVDDIVEGVLARIREAQHATAAHLEATEIEAALRCEMLTAQAELDAELIRLHARREAHAIIAAARQRSGVPQPVQAEHERRRLDRLGEAAMRLAEELEALEADPHPTDHPFRR